MKGCYKHVGCYFCVKGRLVLVGIDMKRCYKHVGCYYCVKGITLALVLEWT